MISTEIYNIILLLLFTLVREQKPIHFNFVSFITLRRQILKFFFLRNLILLKNILQFPLLRLQTRVGMKCSSRLFLDLLLRLGKCAYIGMEGECFSVKFFGSKGFISVQCRKAWPSAHQWLCAAFGYFVTHWCFLVWHAQPVQDDG